MGSQSEPKQAKAVSQPAPATAAPRAAAVEPAPRWSAGNQALARLFRQARLPKPAVTLRVSTPTDLDEQEADRVADQVMRLPCPTGSDPVQTMSISPIIQRKCAACEEEEELQRKVAGSTAALASTSVNEVLTAPGQPLDVEARAFFEPRFGRDFSGVRIHDTLSASFSADSVQARAYTVGQAIVFNTGEYAPSSEAGRQLLAHELAHVVQQGGAPNPSDSVFLQRQTDSTAAGMTSIDAPASVPAPDPTPAPTAPSDTTVVNQSTSSDAEALKEISEIVSPKNWLVGPFQKSKLQDLWGQFGDRLPPLVRADKTIWKLFLDSVERGADLDALPAVDLVKGLFKSDVKALATNYLTQNEQLTNSEIRRLGLDQLGPVYTEEQRTGMDEIQRAARELHRAEDYKASLLRIPVGTDFVPDYGGMGMPVEATAYFEPSGPPPFPSKPTADAKQPTWQETKQQYDRIEGVVAGLMTKYPALAALQTAGSLDVARRDDPTAARAALAKGFGLVLENITRSRDRLATDDLDYRDLQPIHAQIFRGLPAPSGIAWSNPFDQWVARDVLSHHESVEFWTAVGVGTAAAALFIVAEFATAGWATVLVASGAVIGGGQAVSSWEKYLALADAQQANIRSETTLVGSGQASEALFTAVLDSVFFFLDAYSAAVRVARSGGTALERTGVRAAGRGAAEREAKELTEREGAALAERETRAAGHPSEVLRDINPETAKLLQDNPWFRELLEANPLAARAYKLCKSLCYLLFGTKETQANHLRRLNEALTKGAAFGIEPDNDFLREFLHASKNATDQGRRISALEDYVERLVQQPGIPQSTVTAQAFAEAAERGGSIDALDFAHELTTEFGRLSPAWAALPNWAKAGLEDLLKFRRSIGAIPSAGGAVPDGGVVARLDIAGQTKYGVNAHGRRIKLRVNPLSAKHAEADAFQQAADAGLRAESARLFVDAPLCGACLQESGVASLARQLGISSLEVISPEGVIPLL